MPDEDDAGADPQRRSRHDAGADPRRRSRNDPVADPQRRSRDDPVADPPWGPRGDSAGPPRHGEGALKPRRGDLLLLVAVCLVAFFAGLGQPSLWEPDEPRFIQSSREMLERGDWLTPWFNGEPRFHKPILLYWMQLAGFLVLGVGELAGRLPAAAAGMGSVLLVYLLGLRLGSRRMALLSAVVLATTFRVVAYARHGLTDLPLLAFVLAGLYGLLRAADAEPGGSGRRWALLAWAAMGLGVLTKGPVGLLPLLIWVVWAAAFRRPALARIHWAWGLVVLAAVSLPWFAAMVAVHGTAYLELALLSEFVARYAEEGAHGPDRGGLYFFKVWPADLTPWTLLFVGGALSLVLGWRRLAPSERRATLLAGTWFVLVLAVFSLSQGKLPHYIIPAYPAAALLVGLAVDAAARGSIPGLPLWLAGGLTAGLLGVAAPLALRFEQRLFGSALLSPALLVPGALVIGAVAVAIAAGRRRAVALATALAACFLAVYLVLAVWLVPAPLEEFKPIPELSRAIVEAHRPGQRVALYGDLSGQSFVYYTGLRIEWLTGIEQARDLLAAERRCFLVTRGDALPALREAAPGRVHVLAEEPLLFVRLEDLLDAGPLDDRRTLVVVSNRPAG